MRKVLFSVIVPVYIIVNRYSDDIFDVLDKVYTKNVCFRD